MGLFYDDEALSALLSDLERRIELVPESRAGDFSCRSQTITVADFLPHSSTVAFGAFGSANGTAWTGSKSIASFIERSGAFAVEVSRGRVSWFVNGRVIGTAAHEGVVPDVPMTMRISMVDSGTAEMNRTQLIGDWQRGYSLARGRLNTGGTVLSPRSYTGC